MLLAISKVLATLSAGVISEDSRAEDMLRSTCSAIEHGLGDSDDTLPIIPFGRLPFNMMDCVSAFFRYEK